MIMKKIFTLLLASSFILSNADAQTKFNVKAGVNRSGWSGDEISNFNNLLEFADGYVNTSNKTGFYAGVSAEIPLSNSFALEGGLGYSLKGYSLKGNIAADKLEFLGAGASANLNSHYIDMPVYLKANIGEGFHVYAGPQVSYLLKNDLRVKAGALGFNLFNQNYDVTDQFNKVDVALSGGVGYTFNNGVTINAGYDHGLSRLDKNGNMNAYNRNVKVGLGFRF
jgi:hypothetical protein